MKRVRLLLVSFGVVGLLAGTAAAQNRSKGGLPNSGNKDRDNSSSSRFIDVPNYSGSNSKGTTTPKYTPSKVPTTVPKVPVTSGASAAGGTAKGGRAIAAVLGGGAAAAAAGAAAAGRGRKSS